MKKMFFFAAIASVALASCTNDESVFDGAVNGNEINFAVAQYTPQTRAEHDPDVDFDDDITIWSWYNGADTTRVIPGDVYNPGSDTFAGNRKYYWPVNGQTLDFVAVPTDIITKGYFTNPTRGLDGTTTLTFTIDPTDDYHDTNIMTTEVIKNASSGTGSVALLFRHLLSKINIKVAQKVRQTPGANPDARWLVTIKDIKVSGLKRAGSVVINDSWVAKNATDDDKFWGSTTDDSETWQVTDGLKPLYASINDGAAQKSYTSDGPYYMLPQDLQGGDQKITIVYTIETDYLGNPTQLNTVEEYSKTFALKDVTAITHWAMNKVITYNISIDPSEELSPIKFDVNEEVWGEVPGTAPDVKP